MLKQITQKVVFKNTTAKALYDLYMNAKKHAIATAAPAKIEDKIGSKFSAHDGYITGTNIYLVKNSLIVQTWRGADWSKDEEDSIFTIFLEPKGKNVTLHAIHANIPAKHADGINKGWYTHYWEPWKQFLAGKPIAEHPTM